MVTFCFAFAGHSFGTCRRADSTMWSVDSLSSTKRQILSDALCEKHLKPPLKAHLERFEGIWNASEDLKSQFVVWKTGKHVKRGKIKTGRAYGLHWKASKVLESKNLSLAELIFNSKRNSKLNYSCFFCRLKIGYLQSKKELGGTVLIIWFCLSWW